jgi:hypothetical protein
MPLTCYFGGADDENRTRVFSLGSGFSMAVL